MKEKLHHFIHWNYDDIKDTREKNIVKANKLTAVAMLDSALVLLVSYILTVCGVFTLGNNMMLRVFAESAPFLLIPAIICLILKGRKGFIKYMLTISATIAAFIVFAHLSYDVEFILLVPILLSARYYSKKVLTISSILTGILLLVAEFHIAFSNNINLNILGENFVLIKETDTIFEGYFVEGYTTLNYLGDLLRKDFLPKLLVFTVIEFICYAIVNANEKMIKEQSEEASKDARINSELKVATEIQTAMLPSQFPIFPNHNEFDVFAYMNPAKEVGGDFYDLFEIDADHIAIVIADVSGKGIAAALFSMIAKTMIKDNLEANLSLEDALTKVNKNLCKDNSVGMFATAWVGVLELSSGKITYVNAGHTPPLIKKKEGEFIPLVQKKELILAGMEQTIYHQFEIQLEPDDKIFLYTDGITEATNKNEELYGEARLLAYLNKNKDENCINTVNGVVNDTYNFFTPAEQFDDMTIVMIEYYGKKNEIEESFLAKDALLDDVQHFIDTQLENNGADSKTILGIELVTEELFINVCHYAYEQEGSITIRFKMKNKTTASIDFIDSGKKFNPLEKKDPDISLPASERAIGGLGIFMTKKIVDNIKYQYKNNQNILTITKTIK